MSFSQSPIPVSKNNQFKTFFNRYTSKIQKQQLKPTNQPDQTIPFSSIAPNAKKR
jgi:hypothetical protein